MQIDRRTDMTKLIGAFRNFFRKRLRNCFITETDVKVLFTFIQFIIFS
jgi:hypothetical protein